MVLVDTTLWSLALRRRRTQLSPEERVLLKAWTTLVKTGRACLIGPIRQEVLSGIRHEEQFQAIREQLGAFRYLDIVPLDYDEAASFFNRCRAAGIAGTPVDMLLCAVAHRCQVPIFTTDEDFTHYALHLPIRLYRAAAEEGADAV